MNNKLLERVAKLMRLAAPNSGATEAERASAALEAAKLVAEHDLSVQAKDAPAPAPKRERKRRPQSSPSPYGSPAGYGNPFAVRSKGPGGDWTPSIAQADAVCCLEECQGHITRGEPVWRRLRGFNVQYIHRGIDGGGPCGW